MNKKNLDKKVSKVPWKLHLIYTLALFMVGFVWALSSPISSAADDDYHLTSIWCQKESPNYCERIDEFSVLVPAKLNTGKIPEKFTGMPPCYVTWPYLNQSAECLKNVGDGKSYSDRINTSINAKMYYKIVSYLVSENTENSVLRIRFLNLIIFCGSIFLLLLVSEKRVGQKLVLSIGLGIIPVGMFFIVSTNPISWSIISIITNSIFLLKVLQDIKAKQTIEKLAIAGYLLSIFIGVSSRLDSVFYLAISNVAIMILIFLPKFNENILFKSRAIRSGIQVAFSIIIFVLLKSFLEFYHGQKIQNLNSVNDQNNPSPIINILIEIPGFILGILGGQEPKFYQNRGTLGRDFTFGVGWLEYNFLSITGIFIGAAVAIMFFSHLKTMNLTKRLIINLYITSFITLIIIERALWGYLEGAYFQPRYFVAFLISFLFVLFINDAREVIYFSESQLNLVLFLLTAGGIMAWRLVFVRYTSGLNYPITNFFLPVTWETRFLSTKALSILGFFSHTLFYYLTIKFQKQSLKNKIRFMSNN
jgi:hypothetical protein